MPFQVFSLYDLFLTPFYIALLFGFANYLRPRLTDATTQRYFFPALGIKLIGSLAFALLYHFYYGGGDTTAFYMGSARIWKAFKDSPALGVQLLFTSSGELDPAIAHYVRDIRFFYSAAEWNLIRIAGFLGLFCFSTHLVLSCFFGFFCFLGLWQFYRTMLKFFPSFSLPFALAIFLAPSAIFWGSGIMKDTITLGALGFLVAAAMNVFYFRKRNVVQLTVLIGMSVLIFSLKSYLLLTFIAAFGVWAYFKFQESIQNPLLRVLSFPFISAVGLAVGYVGITQIAKGTEYNSVESIQERVFIYQVDHAVRAGGSSYVLEVDVNSPASVLAAFPRAVNVALFRPYPWEAGSIVVLITSFESTTYFLLTLFILFSAGPIQTVRNVLGDPELAMCIVFTLILAFAIGITSFNFGALARFKIPLLPFFGCALAILYKKPKLRRKNRQQRYILDAETIEQAATRT